ncbi:GTPase Era [Kangiella koreensis]|uniref:GTPase Era n=1 Tax=Kangiella koreensis (strain DSM 16069 / JCM 12317 / KCTC 12182 / SW-125) TaxID=523791 RepID=C7RA57_KANKD|nr:GTPase Era [Kangiella koreensis]ACV26176.1 GTP-binding protein Era [Kangiella koreensis DSM 16069]
MHENFRCGYAAVLGRPNVGKSTLMNHILGQKVSITSRKPQTTRHRILGIYTDDDAQILFVDTPGIHKNEARSINRYMNRAASSSMVDVDVVIFVIDGTQWTEDDELVLEKLQKTNCKTILFVNKVDKIQDKNQLLPHLAKITERFDFDAVFPGSALRGDNLEPLVKQIKEWLPKGDLFFPEDYVTDRSQRFMAAELIREKLMRSLGEEIPYSSTVEIEQFKTDEKGILHINGLILVERAGQKAIIIGKQGQRLKQIGQDARIDMEELFGSKVFLQLWVKVKDGWADDERALRSLGYDEN